jgi:hypothetical protein
LIYLDIAEQYFQEFVDNKIKKAKLHINFYFAKASLFSKNGQTIYGRILMIYNLKAIIKTKKRNVKKLEFTNPILFF